MTRILLRKIDYSGSSLPSGGTAGQVLTKKSDADVDVEWKDAGETTELTVAEVTAIWEEV